MNKMLTFPRNFLHKHPPLQNVNELVDERTTLGHRASDWVASTIGSWRFIIIQSFVLMGWVILNIIVWIKHWDPYPFILMNLVLSLQAAYAAPIIMMSQNRQAARDRLEARNDYLVNLKAEEGIHTIVAYLQTHNEVLSKINEKLEKISEVTQK
jgi:uncharacterized membrane protein